MNNRKAKRLARMHWHYENGTEWICYCHGVNFLKYPRERILETMIRRIKRREAAKARKTYSRQPIDALIDFIISEPSPENLFERDIEELFAEHIRESEDFLPYRYLSQRIMDDLPVPKDLVLSYYVNPRETDMLKCPFCGSNRTYGPLGAKVHSSYDELMRCHELVENRKTFRDASGVTRFVGCEHVTMECNCFDTQNESLEQSYFDGTWNPNNAP